jgi:NitT/TauT family transport system ATP-binding protein
MNIEGESTGVDAGKINSLQGSGNELPAAEYNAPVLTVRGLSVTFPNENGGLKALQGVSFALYPREFACLLGPSGSGKSTLLRVLAGLLKPTSGEVIFSGEKQPNISLVFQDANLMPWRTVIENISLPLELQGVPSAEARQRASEWIVQVGLTGFEDTWPGDLSGGMAQRVAIARSLIQAPDLLLLDEPFGALDALTREKMGDELLNLWQSHRTTVLMVTHSIGEALLLSDRVLVLTPRPGRIGLDLPVDLSRPRQEGMRYTEHFGALARQLRAAIR